MRKVARAESLCSTKSVEWLLESVCTALSNKVVRTRAAELTRTRAAIAELSHGDTRRCGFLIVQRHSIVVQ